VTYPLTYRITQFIDDEPRTELVGGCVIRWASSVLEPLTLPILPCSLPKPKSTGADPNGSSKVQESFSIFHFPILTFQMKNGK
jgi:hypothetical protein